MENAIFEFVGIYGVFMHVFYKKHCKHQCIVKYTISDMLCCQSVAKSGVLATLAFLVVAETS